MVKRWSPKHPEGNGSRPSGNNEKEIIKLGFICIQPNLCLVGGWFKMLEERKAGASKVNFEGQVGREHCFSNLALTIS